LTAWEVLRAGAAFAAALTGAAFFLAGGAGLLLRAGVLTFEAFEAFVAAATAFFGAGALRAGAAFADLPFAPALAPALVLDLGALRAGAFSEDERLTIGFGRALFPANVRLLAEDGVEF
jgi:hypothetical protein